MSEKSKVTASELVLAAIFFLQQKNGVTAGEITKFICEKRGSKSKYVKRAVKKALDRATSNGIFSKTRGLYRIENSGKSKISVRLEGKGKKKKGMKKKSQIKYPIKKEEKAMNFDKMYCPRVFEEEPCSHFSSKRDISQLRETSAPISLKKKKRQFPVRQMRWTYKHETDDDDDDEDFFEEDEDDDDDVNYFTDEQVLQNPEEPPKDIHDVQTPLKKKIPQKRKMKSRSKSKNKGNKKRKLSKPRKKMNKLSKARRKNQNKYVPQKSDEDSDSEKFKNKDTDKHDEEIDEDDDQECHLQNVDQRGDQESEKYDDYNEAEVENQDDENLEAEKDTSEKSDAENGADDDCENASCLSNLSRADSQDDADYQQLKEKIRKSEQKPNDGNEILRSLKEEEQNGDKNETSDPNGNVASKNDGTVDRKDLEMSSADEPKPRKLKRSSSSSGFRWEKKKTLLKEEGYCTCK